MKNKLVINKQSIFEDFATIYDLQNSATDTKAVDGFQIDFDVTVTNTSGQTKDFHITYQTVDRNNNLMAYNGYEMYPEGFFDESQELLEFSDYDETLLYELETIAEKECKEYLNKHSEEN